MNFKQYFQQLGFTEKETEIFLALYKLGKKPASTIAKYINLERTYVYKSLIKMVDKGIILMTEENGIKQFFISDLSLLKNYVIDKKQELESLEDNYSVIENELSQYTNKISYIPKISIYEGIDGIRNLYNDIYMTTIQKGYFIVKFFATNTFTSQISVNETIKDYYDNLFQKLQKENITIDAYLGNGDLILEQIYRTNSIANLDNLPAGNSSLNMFVVGDCVYILIFKEIPFGLKFDSEDFANVIHFLFEHLKIDNE